MKTLEKEIMATLAFFSVFQKSLNLEELFENLYRENPLTGNRTGEQIVTALKSLEDKGLVDTDLSDGKPSVKLKGTDTRDYSPYNEKLMAKVHRWSWIFKFCPFLELVSVCNTLGFNTAKEDSDIDFFIVTKNGRLFLGRTFVTLITQILGLRRHGRKVSERFCLSFMVDAGDQSVYKLAFEQDIYFTYWLKNLRIVYARNSSAIENLAENNKYWVSKYLHHPNFSVETAREGKYLVARTAEFLLAGMIGDFFEKLLRNWQLDRARKKAAELPDLTGTILTETVLKFHDIDKRREIHEKWESTYKRIHRDVHL